MPSHEVVALACPYCRGEITQPLHWFRQPYFSCPACAGGLTAEQFATLVDELDQLFEASVTEMLQGPTAGGCGCGNGGCH